MPPRSGGCRAASFAATGSTLLSAAAPPRCAPPQYGAGRRPIFLMTSTEPGRWISGHRCKRASRDSPEITALSITTTTPICSWLYIMSRSFPLRHHVALPGLKQRACQTGIKAGNTAQVANAQRLAIGHFCSDAKELGRTGGTFCSSRLMRCAQAHADGRLTPERCISYRRTFCAGCQRTRNVLRGGIRLRVIQRDVRAGTAGSCDRAGAARSAGVGPPSRGYLWQHAARGRSPGARQPRA